MPDMDRMIDDALDAEERALLRSIGDEPGFVGQALGLFRGRTGWVNIVLMVVQGVAFVLGVWAGWRFFAAPDVLEALRWGLPSAVLLLMSLLIKMAMWPAIHVDRLMRELKRVELLVAHGRRD
jgi:hypothetical protein